VGQVLTVERTKVRFVSGDDECVAWFWPGTNGACVVMAGGLGVTKEPGTGLFAARFQQAGFGVLAFDYRRLGESGGRPRQTVDIDDQLDDWQAAIDFAATLPDIDPAKIAVWAFSLSGGFVFPVAAKNPQLAAAIAQTPNADGPAASRNAARHQTPRGMLRLTGRIVLDLIGGLVGRSPRLVSLFGPPGTVALLTTPDSQLSNEALDPDNEHQDWIRGIAARSIPRIMRYRPGRLAAEVRVPLLVLVADQDQSALAQPAVDAAAQAPRAELVRLPGGHYAPFLEQHERAVEAELEFLRRHVTDQPDAVRAADPSTTQPA
jgi:pimeloyl-ACP methyl ester carboxylesterase